MFPIVPIQSTIPDSLDELLADYGALVGQVIAFVVAFVVVYLLGRIVVVPLTERALDRRGFDETVRSMSHNLLHALSFAIAVGIAFTVAGFGSVIAAFATLAGAIALAIGFAAQGLLANFVSGIFILKDRPFEIGDWIEWDDHAGIVEEIDLRVTRVRTFDNERITVPNTELADNPVKNPVAYDRLRQKFTFGIGYDDDIGEAMEIITEEADAHEAILEEPPVSIRVTDLGDSAVGLQTRFWIGDPSRSDFVKIRSELVRRVKERFDGAGIDMPYPYRQLTGSVELDGEFVTERPATADD